MTAARAPLPVAILISGRGSNMAAIATRSLAGTCPYRVDVVISDRADAAGLVRARELGLRTEVLTAKPGQSRSEYDAELSAALRRHSPAVVALAGFMRILSSPLVEEYAGRMLNIHPSLLPKFPGLHTHARALAEGVSEHGCSVHFVTAELDGGPVIIQGRIAVEPGDDASKLAARVQVQEHRIYPLAIDWLATGRLEWGAGTPRFDGKPMVAPIVLDYWNTAPGNTAAASAQGGQ
jgi:phosphoribosylglycinamide formyltransferase 1